MFCLIFFIVNGELGRKLRPLCVSGCTTSCRQNPEKPLINRICRVINPHYEETNDDLEAPYGFPNGRVPLERIGKRRPVERGRPGQEWLVDLSEAFFGQLGQPRFAMDFRYNRH